MLHSIRLFVMGSGIACCALFARPLPAAGDAAVAPTMLDGLEWRLLGPFRSGWSTMAVGVAQQPDTYYSAYAGGGVWKTTDGGQTWKPVTDKQPIVTVGALAVAPSDPRVIYVGTGQPEERYDIGSGSGVYRSGDGGATWQSVGLPDSRHIGAVYVDPRNADVVFVAALGHLYGRNEERGVYRSSDGGKNWSRVLYVDPGTGAVDIAADPADPDHIYAATWTTRQWPWLSYFMPGTGPGSGIHESHDNGRTWKRLAGKGLPAGDLGRIGLAVGRTTAGTRVYASVDARDEHDSGLYRSDNGGADWSRVNEARSVTNSYFSRVTLDPRDSSTVYIVGQSIKKSTDGGQHFTVLRGSPGGDDYHSLWINPAQPERMIAASDQGTVVSVNGGASWTSWYNAPTGQFYYLAADNAFPYRVYSGQQDSGTVGIASRSDYGALSLRDWTPVGGDERDYDIPDPADANIVYATGLGGRLARWDRRTGTVQNITPWPVNSYGRRPTDFRYRYSWFTPIAFGGQPPYPLYFATQKLLRSTDRGLHWQEISPQLSRHDPSFAAADAGHGPCAGDVLPPVALKCGYGVIYSLAPAPQDNDEIWIGTDDGVVQLTRDGGRSWHDVTPPGVAPWAKIARIDVSALARGTAYVAVDNHRQDEYAPHAWRTRDYGATWTDISVGLPAGSFVNVVRADPKQAGLLYAGTDYGVQVSFDDGAHWQSLQQNLPPAWYNDLLVHGDDLIAATQGRAIWVLDDLSRLRQLAAGDQGATRLFQPATALRWRSNQNKDTPPPPETPLGTNPPEGAIIDYAIAAGTQGEVVLEIRDQDNRLVRRYSSNDQPEKLAVERYFAADWLAPARLLSASPGAHRFVWDLRYPRPRAASYKFSISTSRAAGTPIEPRGPLVLPGRYQLALIAGGERHEATLDVAMDPRTEASTADLQAALEFARQYGAELDGIWRSHREIASLREAIDGELKTLGPKDALRQPLQSLKARTEPWVDGISEHTLNLNAINETLADIVVDVEGSDRAPTEAQRTVAADCVQRAHRVDAQWKQLREHELAAANQRLRQAGHKEFAIPAPDQLGPGEPDEGTELP
jgi:photosystem II stability/assembly factor-like uncharacterized protein